ALGLLFQPFAETAYRFPLTVPILTQVQWPVLWTQGATLLALFFITMIDLLLVASGLELALKTNVDFDRELRVTGAANMVSGLFGGFVSCLSTSRTLLNHKAGATGRLAGLVVAIIGVVMLRYGGPLVSYIPKPILGGLLLYLGLSLLVQWLYETRQKFTRPDYLLVWVILIAMAVADLLIGIAVGILIATIIFTVTYSRIPIFKHSLAGSDYPSNRSRSVPQRRYLNSHGHKIQILWLQGYLFFGTASQLADHVSQVLDRHEQSLQFLILDFHHVTGADASVLSSFTKVQRIAQEREIVLIYTSLPAVLLEPFVQEKLLTAPTEAGEPQPAKLPAYRFPDLDHGIEWCEDQLLREGRLHRQAFVPLALHFYDLFPTAEQLNIFMEYLDEQRAQG
ncbi:MAG: SulP family inorganic anion transporter, partial [Caldilineaceae bacterium]|nr:SulP family inorganic anion transporter [Caldilineaceae bacterium]